MTCCCICSLSCLALFVASTGYAVYKGVNSLKGTEAEQKKWLTVWSIIAVLLVLERFTIYLNQVPGYCLLKSLFIIWLYHEKYQGAQLLYTKFVEPQKKILDLVLQYTNKIQVDKILLNLSSQ